MLLECMKLENEALDRADHLHDSIEYLLPIILKLDVNVTWVDEVLPDDEVYSQRWFHGENQRKNIFLYDANNDSHCLPSWFSFVQ